MHFVGNCLTDEAERLHRIGAFERSARAGEGALLLMCRLFICSVFLLSRSRMIDVILLDGHDPSGGILVIFSAPYSADLMFKFHVI